MKMPYTLELHFDQETDHRVKSIWNDLSNECGEKYMISSGFPPHMTLGLYDGDFDKEKFETIVSNYQKRFSPIDITLSSFGVFSKGDELSFYLAPNSNINLLELHRDLHTELEPFKENALTPNYFPSLWTPHCTITMGTDSNNASTCIDYIKTIKLPINATMTKIFTEKFEF